MTGKERNKFNLVLDILMLFTMIFIYSAKGEMHETFGYTLGILATIHIVLHWKQIKVMFKQF